MTKPGNQGSVPARSQGALTGNPVEGALGCLEQLDASVGCIIYGAGFVVVILTTALGIASGDVEPAATLIRRVLREAGLAVLVCTAAWAIAFVIRRWWRRRRASL